MASEARRFEVTYWEAESPELYHPGGFHPTHLGDVLNNRYKIVRKLGSASFSTVWLARDEQENRYVAIKVGTAGAAALADAVIAAHHAIQASAASAAKHPGQQHVVPLLDHFLHVGPNGQHPCLVFPPRGRTMGAFVSDGHLVTVPSAFARALCRQLMLALDCVHSAGLAHRDIHPGNVLLGLSYDIDAKTEDEVNEDINLEIPREDGDGDDDNGADDEEEENGGGILKPRAMYPVKRIDRQPLTEHEPHYLYEPCPLPDGVQATDPPSKLSFHLSDLGAATAEITSSPAADDTTSPYPGALGLRSPQVVLRTHPISYQAADVWALGLTLWDVVVGDRLLSVDELSSPELTDDSHLESAITRLGALPAALRARWPRADDWTDARGRPLYPYGQPELGAKDYDVYWHGDMTQALWHRREKTLTECGWADAEIGLFGDFLGRMLAWEEKDRATAAELLQHVWLKADG